MRVAIAAECFLPQRNGVTNSVLHVIDYLEARGHQAVVLAAGLGPAHYGGAAVERVPAVPLPVYRDLPVALPFGHRIGEILGDFEPDVVHLAAPAVLGPAVAREAHALGVPVIAVYQTDFAGFARRYGLGLAGPVIWALMRRIHRHVDLTLAPSTSAAWQLSSRGIDPVGLWGRGVDNELFHPRRRSQLLHRQLAPRGEVVVGYVGRLASEKRVHLLGHLATLPGVRVVVVGDGPARASLERRMPGVRFLGWRSGVDLATTVASLDVFVHTGPHETFCQAIQEALASGVPVVAPAAGGPLDLVRHADNGWLYPPEAPDLMAEAVAQLAGDAGARRAMGRRARRGVEHRTWSAVGDELLGHYQRLSGPGTRREQVA